MNPTLMESTSQLTLMLSPKLTHEYYYSQQGLQEMLQRNAAARHSEDRRELGVSQNNYREHSRLKCLEVLFCFSL